MKALTIFDVNNLQPKWGEFFAICILLLIGFIVFYYLNRHKTSKIRRISLFLGLFVLFFTANYTTFLTLVSSLVDLKEIVRRNECIEIEEIIENLAQKSWKANIESFYVNKNYFEYNSAAYSVTFNTLLTETKLASNGDRVKICYTKQYRKNKILQFYVLH
jgi:hypothetical protein